jgi:hypothetical protein
MKTEIQSVKIELSIEEVQMLCGELNVAVPYLEDDGRTVYETTMLRKLAEHLEKSIGESNIKESKISYKLKANR